MLPLEQRAPQLEQSTVDGADALVVLLVNNPG